MKSTSFSTRATEGRLGWVDVMRFVAIFLVICCHCCDPFNLSPRAASDPSFGLFGALYGSMLRPCVPLFAMLTGLLVLPIQGMSTGTFYKKRILRVVVPLFIWSLLYNLFPWIVGVCGGDESVVATFFPYAAAYGATPSLSFGQAVKHILLIPFHFSVYDVHMWYLYMLIGLYLFMPVLSAWLEKSTDKEQRWFLYLWGVTLLFPYVVQYVATYFWGSCSWNAFNMLYYFAGFNGYLVLGNYLKRHHTLSLGKTWGLAVLLFAVGFAITFVGFRRMVGQPTSTEEMIELFWTYCSPNVVMMTLACFLLLQRVRIKKPAAARFFAHTGRYGLGIYMCHYFFVGVGYLATAKMGVPVFLQIPVAAVIVMALSWGLVAGVFKVAPKTAKWVMG